MLLIIIAFILFYKMDRINKLRNMVEPLVPSVCNHDRVDGIACVHGRNIPTCELCAAHPCNKCSEELFVEILRSFRHVKNVIVKK